MPNSFKDRLAHAWNVFRNKDPSEIYSPAWGNEMYTRVDRPRFTFGNEQSITAAIYTKIAIDVSTINFIHARVDQNGRFSEEIDSRLNQCLRVEANIDQSARSFFQDVAMSLFDEGAVAIVPVDTTESIKQPGAFDVASMRVGKIESWFPQHVKVLVYNDQKGEKQSIVLPKRNVAIVENPFYAVMNEPNSIAKRLTYKMSMSDKIDQAMSSGKLDLIVQLPYVTKTELTKNRARDRLKSLEEQLSGSKYGIAYADATEKITQLNRPVENNLQAQIEFLTSMLFSQLGLTQAILDGSADEQTMENYYNRTVEPVVAAIADAMRRTFLSKTARAQGQSIITIREPFKLVPATGLADIVDKFTRNEVLTSNEVRAMIGLKPSDDPRADELRNKNIGANKDQLEQSPEPDQEVNDDAERRNTQNGKK